MLLRYSCEDVYTIGIALPRKLHLDGLVVQCFNGSSATTTVVPWKWALIGELQQFSGRGSMLLVDHSGQNIDHPIEGRANHMLPRASGSGQHCNDCHLSMSCFPSRGAAESSTSITCNRYTRGLFLPGLSKLPVRRPSRSSESELLHIYECDE